jgi:hypothetical protein
MRVDRQRATAQTRAMGMDSVEIVMEVEEAFGIQIEDPEAEAVLTPGQLIDLVVSKLSITSSDECLTQRAFHLVRKFFISKWQTPRASIRPTVSLKTLVPRPKRREFAGALVIEVGVPALRMEFPRSISNLILGSSFACAVAVFAASTGPVTVRCLLGFTAAGVIAFFVVRASNNLKTEFPSGVSTVGDLSRWVMMRKPGLSVPQTSTWAREQVVSGVRDIVVRALDSGDKYREDARFIQDLGLG